MFNRIEDGLGDIGRGAALAHGDLGEVVVLHVLDGLGARHLAGGEVLDEEAVHGIAPERAVVEVAGADAVHLHAEGRQLEGERLGEADAAELATGVGEIRLGAAEAALRVDLDDVGVVFRIGRGLDLHDVRGDLGAIEIGLVVDLGDELEVLRSHRFQASGAEDARVGDEHVQGAEIQDGLLHEVLQAVHVGDVGLDEDGAVVPGDLIERSGGRGAHGLIEVGHHDVRALAHELAGDALAEALGRARDDDRLAFHPAGGMASCHLPAVVLHLPVVDEIDPGGFHRVFAAEETGVVSDLHRIEEDLGDDVGVLGVVAHGHEADTLDQQYLRGVSPTRDIGLDLLLGLLHEVVGIKDDVFALAIDDDVRGERQADGLRIGQEAVHERVPHDLQRLDAAAAAGQDLADGRDDVRHFVGNLLPESFRNRLHVRFQAGHNIGIDPVDFFGRIGGDEHAVVLQEDDLRLAAGRRLAGQDAVVHLLEKGVARVRVFDVEGLREEFGAGFRRFHGAHQAVHQRRVQVHHVGEAHAVVQGRFHRRAAALRQARGGQVFLDLGLARGDVGAVRLLPHRIQLATVQDGEPVLADGGEGVAAGLHPQLLRILVGGIPPAGDDIAGVAPVLPGNGDEILDRGHRSMQSSMISSPASALSRPT